MSTIYSVVFVVFLLMLTERTMFSLQSENLLMLTERTIPLSDTRMTVRKDMGCTRSKTVWSSLKVLSWQKITSKKMDKKNQLVGLASEVA